MEWWLGVKGEMGQVLHDSLPVTFCEYNCVFLAPTEKEQNKYGGKIPHRCLKYNKPLYHGPFHPEIVAIRDCKYSIKPKGDRECQKETENANRSENVKTSPQQKNVPQRVSHMFRKTLTKLWNFLTK